MSKAMKTVLTLGLLAIASLSGHSQEVEDREWVLVRTFDEIAVAEGRTTQSVGGFDFDAEGDLVLYSIAAGQFFRYSQGSNYTEREEAQVPAINYGGGTAAWSGSSIMIFFGNGAAPFSHVLHGEDSQGNPVYRAEIDSRLLLNSHTYIFPMVRGNIVIAEEPGNPGVYYSAEVFTDEPERDPEYRNPSQTRELIAERGAELGLYFDAEGFLWAQDEPHDWLFTSNDDTFNGRFGYRRRTGAYGDFMGRDRLGNYYWGGPFRYFVYGPDGQEIADVLPETPNLGAITATRVTQDGVIMFFDYASAGEEGMVTLRLFRLDTGIVTGN